MSEADRYSLEALRSIHQMMDDDQDGGIEVEESVEVQKLMFRHFPGCCEPCVFVCLFSCMLETDRVNQVYKNRCPGW